MIRSKQFSVVFLLIVGLVAVSTSSAGAAIVASGNVEPDDPASWTSSTIGYIGKTADGSVSVDDGSDLVSNYVYLGFNSSVSGTATITGSGSTWTNTGSSYSTFFVGYAGSGSLSITGGATVSNSWGYIGYGSGSTGVVTVDGSGSRWANSKNLYIGQSGSGTLSITGGAAVSSSYNSYIGYGSSSTGIVTVDGPGSTWTNSNDLIVGYGGSGTLHITGGATVSVDDSTFVGYSSVPTGLIDFGSAGGGTLSTKTLCAPPPQNF